MELFGYNHVFAGCPTFRIRCRFHYQEICVRISKRRTTNEDIDIPENPILIFKPIKTLTNL